MAKALSISPLQVRDLVEEGKLTALNIAGAGTVAKHYRIPVSAYDLYIEENLAP